MRNLTKGNKMNFTIFAVIILVILVILVCATVIVLKAGKEEYTISSTSCIYDKDYNYINLSNDGMVTKKWTGNYYLKENMANNEYDLGKYSVAFDKNKKTIELFGTFYQVLRGGNISKITEHTTVNRQAEDKFYKIDDRKYLIVADKIENDAGSLSTNYYLIIIIDKLGNALLLNNEINAKTINEMIISTGDFQFDVANEKLIFDNENIDLKKIIGSTNEYVKQEKEVEEEEEITEEEMIAATGATYTSSTSTTSNNSATTVINGAGGTASSGANTSQDTSWVDYLNSWIQDVASGFQSIYNGNSGNKEESELSKSIALKSLSTGVTYIDINYTVTDPENKYNVVYAKVSDGLNNYTISLDKSATTYRLTGLKPNKNYTADIGYKIIHSDSTVTESVEDTMTTRTKIPNESLTITKVSTDKIYYTLKLDSDFVYDAGAKIVVYINDTTEYLSFKLTSSNLEKAASTGYYGSINIPAKYKTKNSTLKIQLENTTYNGTNIDTNLIAKIVNY